MIQIPAWIEDPGRNGINVLNFGSPLSSLDATIVGNTVIPLSF